MQLLWNMEVLSLRELKRVQKVLTIACAWRCTRRRAREGGLAMRGTIQLEDPAYRGRTSSRAAVFGNGNGLAAAANGAAGGGSPSSSSLSDGEDGDERAVPTNFHSRCLYNRVTVAALPHIICICRVLNSIVCGGLRCCPLCIRFRDLAFGSAISSAPKAGTHLLEASELAA